MVNAQVLRYAVEAFVYYDANKIERREWIDEKLCNLAPYFVVAIERGMFEPDHYVYHRLFGSYRKYDEPLYTIGWEAYRIAQFCEEVEEGMEVDETTELSSFILPAPKYVMKRYDNYEEIPVSMYEEHFPGECVVSQFPAIESYADYNPYQVLGQYKGRKLWPSVVFQPTKTTRTSKERPQKTRKWRPQIAHLIVNITERMRSAYYKYVVQRSGYEDPNLEMDTIVWENGPEQDSQSNPLGERANVETIQAGTSSVMVQETTLETATLPPPIVSSDYIVQEPVNFTGVVDRWAHLDSFSWQTTDEADKEVYTCSVFKTLLQALEGQPIREIFKMYQYVSLDIELLIQVSTTQFHAGQLIAAVYYGVDESLIQALSKNVWSSLQRPHAILKAGAGCEAIVHVPFLYPISMMPCSLNKMLDELCFADVSIRVLNSLRITSGESKVSGTVQFRIKDIKFSGLRPTTLLDSPLTHEMLPELFNMVSNLSEVGKRLLTKNCDKPPGDPQRVGYVPQMMQNPSYVKGVEVINEMRLINNTLTPHFESDSEFTMETWLKTPGFVTTVNWDQTYEAGKNIAVVNVQPIGHSSEYQQVMADSTESAALYCLPPVALASDLAGYYRGSIEIIGDIICTNFHSGRIIIGYLPGNIPPTFYPTLKDIRSMIHCTVDISKEKSFKFSAPYIAPQVVYPTNLLHIAKTSAIPYVGKIFISVLTSLSMMGSVSPKIDMNLYIQAGSDFKLYIPAQPTLVSADDDQKIRKEIVNIEAREGYYPGYFGTWHLFTDSLIALRYGAVSDHIVQFNAMGAVSGIYYLPTKSKVDLKFEYSVDQTEGSGKVVRNTISEKWKYSILVNDNNTYFYVIPIPEKLVSQQALIEAKMTETWQKFSETVAAVTKIFLDWGNLKFTQKEYTEKTPDGDKIHMIKYTYAVAHEIGVSDLVPPTNMLMLANDLQDFHFGEPALNIKDLTKRYQYYTSLTTTEVSTLYYARFIVPILPGGLINKVTDERWYQAGLSRTISKPYLFFKGSMNFKIICNTASTTFWVMHVYNDYTSTGLPVSIPKASAKPKHRLNNGFAYIMQNSNINKCIEISIPYYNACDKIYVNPYFTNSTAIKESAYIQQFCSLGSLYIGSDITSRYEILYSLGDDANFSTFVGFPPATFSSLLWPSMQLSDEDEFEEIHHEGPGILGKIFETPSVKSIAESASTASSSVNEISTQATLTLNKIDKVTDSANSVLESVQGFFDKVKDNLVSSFSWFSGNMMQMFNVLVSNIMHFIIQPTVTVFCVSMASILIGIGVVTVSTMGTLTKILMQIMAYINKGRPDGAEDEISPEGETEPAIPRLAGLIFSSLCSTIGVCLDPPKSFKQFSKRCFGNVGAFSRDTCYVMTFLERIWSLVERGYKYIFESHYPVLSFLDKLPSDQTALMLFVHEVNYLTHPDRKVELMTSFNLYDRLRICKEIGDQFKLYLIAHAELKHSFLPHLDQAIKRITELFETVSETNVANYNRVTPYGLWVYGDPGIGKSQSKDEIMHHLLNGMEGYKPPYFCVVSQVKFWNCFRDQKCIYYDDFGNNRGNDFDSEILPYYQDLISSAPFNVPKAAVTEKEMLAAPYLVYVNSNFSQISSPTIACAGAFERRQRCKVKAYVNPLYDRFYDKTTSSFNFYKYYEAYPNATKQNSHLLFSGRFVDGGSFSAVSYSEFLAQLKIDFDKFYNHEKQLLDNRLKDTTRLSQSPLRSLYQLICGNTRETSLSAMQEQEFAQIFSEGGDDDDLEGAMCLELLRERYPLHSPPIASGLAACPHIDLQLKDMARATYFPAQDNVAAYFKVTVGDEVKTIPYDECKVAGCIWVDKRKRFSYCAEWQRVHPNPLYWPECLDKFYAQRDSFLNNIKTCSVDFCNSLKSFWRARITPSFQKCYQFVKNWGKILGAILGVIATSGLIYGIFTVGKNRADDRITAFMDNFTSPKTHQMFIDRESGDSGNKIIRSKSLNKQAKVVGKTQRRQIAHESTEESISDSIKSITSPEINIDTCIQRNTVFLELQYMLDGLEKFASCRCFCVGGRLIIGVLHYFELLQARFIEDKNMKVWLVSYYKRNRNNAGQRLKLDITKIKFDMYGDSNMFSFEAPLQFAPRRNFVNLIATGKQHSLPMAMGYVIEVRPNDTMIKHRVTCTQRSCFVSASGDASSQSMDMTYNYPVHARGMCGSLLVINNFIYGFHMAGGHKSGGYAFPLVRESFDELITKQTIVIEPDLIEIDDDIDLPIDGSIFPLGVTSKDFTHHQAKVSQIVPSWLHSVIVPSTMEPAPLSAKDQRYTGTDPLVDGCQLHCYPPERFSDSILEEIEIAYTAQLIKNVPPLRMQVGKLQLSPAILGIPGIDGYEKIDMTTSEGYPYKFRRPVGAVNKQWLFEIENVDGKDVLKKINAQLMLDMRIKTAIRGNGDVPFTVFIDALKDIKIPKEKLVKKACTRVFSLSPIDFTIQCRQYLLDFCAAYSSARLKIGSGIGINRNSLEWTDVVQYLGSVPMKDNTIPLHIIAGDYSKFGPTLMYDCVKHVFNNICSWYQHNGDEESVHHSIRQVMGEEMAHAVHLMGNFLYKVDCGAPSGAPLTVILNDMVNEYYLAAMWLLLAPAAYCSMKHFYQYTRRVKYGDDIIMAVSDEVIMWYNVNSLHTKFSEYNIVFTDANKSADGFLDYISLSQATFLKCSFVKHPRLKSVWLAPLELRSIVESWQWVRSTYNMEEDLIINLESAFQNLYAHGPEVYNYYATKIQQYWNNDIRFTKPLIVKPWLYWDKLFFPSYYE